MNRFVLRSIDWLLAAWMGAVLFFSLGVAPVLFEALGPEGAGRIVRQLLPRMDLLTLGLFAVAWVVIRRTMMVGGWSARKGILLLLPLVACTLTLVSIWFVTPKMEALRRSVPSGSVSSLAVDDPIRKRFGTLHGASVGLLAGEWLCGMALWVML